VFGLGIPEIIIIAVILLLIFGGKRLPEIGKSLGRTVSEFRKITKDIRNEKTPTNQTQGEQQQKAETTKVLQNKLVKKVTEQIPGVKDAKNIKEKTDKIKGVLK
jgi:TatA/E family protein of Tat protein translocase